MSGTVQDTNDQEAGSQPLVQSSDTIIPATETIRSEDRFRAFVTATSPIVFTMNSDWSVMQNLEGGGLMADSIGPVKDWMQNYTYPDDHSAINQVIREAIRDKRVFQMEFRIFQVDGSIGWISSRAIPIFDTEGRIMEWFGAASDISERKSSEQAVQKGKEEAERQKRLYEAITSSTPDLVYVFDLQYRFTYANAALLKMWGKTWDQAIGRNLLENGYEPWHAEMHEREIDQVIATKKPIRGEVSFPHATLGRRVYDYIFTPVINDVDQVEAIAGTTRDITEIKQAELTLAESEQRFRTMAEDADVMIAVGDETSNASYFNRSWSDFTGRSVEDLLEFGWFDLVHPDDKEPFTNIYMPAFTERLPFSGEVRVLGKSGIYHWLLTKAHPRFDTNGEFLGYISSTIDITEQKQDVERKNNFIGMVSHELKTPLTSMKAYVQMLAVKSKKEQNEFFAQALEHTDRQIRKMATLINGFLNISRLESGKLVLNKTVFNLLDLIKEIIEEIEFSTSSHNIILLSTLPVKVNADREKIGSVISNLLSNAVKYSPKGTNIELECHPIGKSVQFCIKDEGIGIDEKDREKLFERYYRVDSNHTNHVSGFGIGLYLSAEIVHRHEGKIWVESEKGKGSTFFITLP